MDNYPSYSYPDSGNSSPRSREIDFENPPQSWDEQSTHSSLPPNFKVKFMVSYNGKIQPRSHDNLLSYVGGETKILAVDRSVKFSAIHSKLASLVSPDASIDVTPFSSFTFKYQLPGEDLDALISVSNDDDLEHMMHEYDRMWRGSSKTPRLRLFLFPDHQPRSTGGSAFSSTSSEPGKLAGLDRGSGLQRENSHLPHHQVTHPIPNVVVSDLTQPQIIPPTQPLPVHSKVDFLFGLDKVPGPIQVPDGSYPIQVPVHEMKGLGTVPEPEMIHELNRLHISAQELLRLQLQQQQQQQQQQPAMYVPKNDENFADPYQKISSPKNIPANIPVTMQIPQGYWQPVDHHQPQHQHNQVQQLHHQNYPQQQQQQPPQMQHHQQYHPQQQPQQQPPPVYMMHAPPQGMLPQHQPYFQVPQQQQQQQQRMPSEQVYREQPVYNMPTSAPTPVTIPATAQVRPVMTGESAGFAQVAYDGATGRQVYYAATGAPAQGGIVSAPFPTPKAVSGEMRGSGDGKIVHKVGASSPAV